jgi:GAF domain-containing protein
MQIKSVKEESILRQFGIYFVVASVIPFFTFLYLLSQFATGGRNAISGFNLILLIVIAGLLAILGFIGARGFLTKITLLSSRLKKEDLGVIDRATILELARGEGEIALLARVFGDITGKLENNVRQLEETKLALHRVLSKIGKAISSVENFDLLIQVILETIVEAVEAKRGVIFSLDEERQMLVPKSTVGVEKNSVPVELAIGQEAAGWVAKERKPLFVPSFEEQEKDSVFAPPLIATPLIVHDKLWGVITISGKKGNTGFSEDELKILSNLGFQIAVAFENAKLNNEAEKTYFETISALALAVEAKDTYSNGHSQRVAEYAGKIAERLNLSQEVLNTLADAARLHDIGKIGIADDILKKPGRLTDEEMSIMRQHPAIGEGIVKPLRSFRRIVGPIRHHHELLDGSGYPDALKGEEIPLITRVLTVSDIFDAVTSNRPYRKSLSMEEARHELQVMIDKGKIDASVVAALLALVDEKKIMAGDAAAR